MTISDQPTELLPALLYESLPKPSPYPFDEPPAPAKSRQRHPHLEISLRIPHYPGMAYQAPTPGYPPTPLGAQAKPARRDEEPHQPPRHSRRPQPEPRDPRPPARASSPIDPRPPAQSPSAIRRTGSLAGFTGHQIRDMLIHAAAPPTVSLLNPTGKFAQKVDAVARARQAEERIPKHHLPKRRLTLRLWRLLPVLLLVATCRHCGRPWPCHRLRRHLTGRHGKDIDLPVLRLSTKRRRKRADRRSPTAITHRPKPRRIDKQEQQLGLK